jgi:hypothetical protein
MCLRVPLFYWLDFNTVTTLRSEHSFHFLVRRGNFIQVVQ